MVMETRWHRDEESIRIITFEDNYIGFTEEVKQIFCAQAQKRLITSHEIPPPLVGGNPARKWEQQLYCSNRI